MKKTALLIINLLCLSGMVRGQFYETVRSGRPGQSIGASTVGKDIFQIQSGVDYFGYENTNAKISGNGYLTNAALRYGLTDRFEIGGFLEYRTESITDSSFSASREGFSNVLIGLRHQISTGNGLAPSVGFQFRLRLPVGSSYYRTANLAPSFIFVTSQQWSRFTLITNLGGSWNGSNATPTGLYTVNFSCAFTSTFGAFIESYGSLTSGFFESRFDTGVAWLVTNNLQVDFLGGLGSNRGLNDYFVSTGFSWRTNRKEDKK